MRRNQKPKNPWNKSSPQQNGNTKQAEEKFKAERAKLQQAVDKFTKDFESSEEEEEIETNVIIETALKNYDGGVSSQLAVRTKGFLEEAFVSGAHTCLICISSIKRNQEIWNCSACYCIFHLMCIQRWSKDTIFQKKQALEEQIQARPIHMKWGCPKCRHEYGPEDIPSEYRCFCNKLRNPPFQSLIIPHSCGETCGRDLQPYCGHGCLLLCHPGPCPPCPKMIKTTCYCGASPMRAQRCSNKDWSCGKPCNKLLACDKHKCTEPCHFEKCKPCPKKSMQKCLCGNGVQMRDCSTPIWQCDKVCKKPLQCGFHNCEEICHTGFCGECLLSKMRTCPCGKTYHQLPCTEETPTCGNTCNKLLECGMHVCNQRCHKGQCMTCVETVTKSCRCGLHTKEVQCRKTYTCETKCKQMKDCNKHPCKRKCCDGDCPPCEKPCGRTLNCRKHPCNSVCHRGPCYPCNLTEKVYCHCGDTYVTVPCGKRSKTKPPKCLQLCKIPTECHHETREPHRCHFGDCPPCRQICNKSRPTCSHNCPSACHSVVVVKLQGEKALTPWEEKGPQFAKKALPCPNCIVPMPVTCLGEHETCDWPCHKAKPSSCHKACGRLLTCGNHFCSNECHIVLAAPDDIKAGQNCEHCDSGCTKPRPELCVHECPKPCHPGPCPPCKQMLRIKCHCGLTQPYVECNMWSMADNRDEIQSCGNQCPKNFPCGHRCKLNCHPGVCPYAEMCKKKVKVTCPCKRLKKEFSCETNRKGRAVINCDDLCLRKRREEKLLKDKLNEERLREEEERNEQEIQKYVKKFQPKRKNRDRRIIEEMDNQSFLHKYWIIIVALITCLVAVYLFRL